jgi:hypothetical protein
MSEPTRPDFFLVGAPKCGTSALYDYLRQHPQLFLPATKELLRFGSDLSYPTRLSEAAFAAHFQGRTGELRAGTAHTAYLQSRLAASEIEQYQPDADILIMLRDPVEMLHSWHSELLYETIEDIEDFGDALAAEADRRADRRIPRSARNSYVESLFYSDVAAFAAQVERFIETFGADHVHVALLDDLRAQPEVTYREALEFLRVDPTHAPKFSVVNPNKAVRSRRLQRIFFSTATPGHATVKRLMPRRLRRALLERNVRETSRSPMSPELERRLRTQFAPAFPRLGRLINRDLSAWMP